MKLINRSLFSLFLLFIIFGIPKFSAAITIIDDDQTDFGAGIYSDSQWDSGNTWVELTPTGQTNGEGTFTSSIKNAGSVQAWTTIGWTPERPYYKNLPNNGTSETVYNDGNANMSNNAFLMHLDDASGATTFNGTSSNNNDGSCLATTCPSRVIGRLNRAFDFDGNDDFIQVPNSTSLNISGSAITIELWVKPAVTLESGSPLGTYETFVSKEDNSTGGGYGLLYDLDRGEIQFSLADDPDDDGLADPGVWDWPSWNAPYTLNADTWYHIAAVWSGSTSTAKIFVNGVEVTSGTSKLGVGDFAIDDNSGAVLSLGNWQDIATRFYDGALDEVAVFSRALSDTEIEDHYKRGALRMLFQVRTCDDALCDTEQFVGPGGSSLVSYTEMLEPDNTLPEFNLAGLSTNQYFQYQATFRTDNTSFSPELNDVTMNHNDPDDVASVPEFSTATYIIALILSLVFFTVTKKYYFDPKKAVLK